MDHEALRATALSILTTIAPEIEPAELDATRPLRHQVDLDSMDWLNYLVALNERLHIEIPEADYARLRTLDDLVGYLARRLESTPGAGAGG